VLPTIVIARIAMTSRAQVLLGNINPTEVVGVVTSSTAVI